MNIIVRNIIAIWVYVILFALLFFAFNCNMRRKEPNINVYVGILSTNTRKRDIKNLTTLHFRFLSYQCEYLQMSSSELKMSYYLRSNELSCFLTWIKIHQTHPGTFVWTHKPALNLLSNLETFWVLSLDSISQMVDYLVLEDSWITK